MDLLTDTHYWIKHEDTYTPVYHNYEKQWKVLIANKTRFITYAKLKSIFGKECLIREVNFDTDKMQGELPKHGANILLFPFAFQSDTGKNTIAMKNNNVILIDNMIIPSSQIEDCFYLDYCEETKG